MNLAIVIGNLGQDPEIRETANGKAVGNFSIATTDKWKDKDGNPQEKTEWHQIVVWGRDAEVAGQYLRKGSKVCVQGSLQTREWTDKNDNKRKSTEIKCFRFEMLTPKSSESAGPAKDKAPPPTDADDIPF